VRIRCREKAWDMKTSLRSFTYLPHRLAHAFFMEIVIAFAFEGKVDVPQVFSRARDGRPPEPQVCVRQAA